MAKKKNYTDASLTKRGLSYLIDWYVGALCAALPISLVSQKLYGTMTKQNLLKIQQPYGAIAGVIGLLLALLYYIYIPYHVYKGQTLGKHICKIKMVQTDDQDVSLKSLILRQGVGIIIIEGALYSASTLWHQLVTLLIHVNVVTPLMYIGLAIGAISTVMVLFTKKHRAIHDYIGNTKVVNI